MRIYRGEGRGLADLRISARGISTRSVGVVRSSDRALPDARGPARLSHAPAQVLVGLMLAVVLGACSSMGVPNASRLAELQASSGLEQYRRPCQTRVAEVNLLAPPTALGGDQYTVAELRDDQGLSDWTKEQLADLSPTQIVLVWATPKCRWVH